MAVLSPQVRYEEVNGPSSVAVRGPSLTQIGRRPADRVTPVVCHFSLAAQSQSARLQALDEECSHGGHMERRGFISLLGGAAVWPVVASAQQPLKPVIGFLSSASPVGWDSYLAAFRDGLRYRVTMRLCCRRVPGVHMANPSWFKKPPWNHGGRRGHNPFSKTAFDGA